LESKSNGSQLKDAVALQVFTLEKPVTLLANGNLHGALNFRPIVLWPLGNHALNIAGAAQIQLLGIAF
jgi:hypothetical protein